MKTITFGVSTIEDLEAEARAAFRGDRQGEHITFESAESLLAALTAPRRAILTTMAGAGPMSIRELGRRLDRDVKRLHEDVTALLQLSVLQRTEDGKIEFPYDAVRVEFTLKAA